MTTFWAAKGWKIMYAAIAATGISLLFYIFA